MRINMTNLFVANICGWLCLKHNLHHTYTHCDTILLCCIMLLHLGDFSLSLSFTQFFTFMIFRNNETSEARDARLDSKRINTATARRSQSPTTSRHKRTAATAARSKLREQLSPEESQEEKKRNTLSRALKRKTMPEDQSAEIRQNDADRKRKKANQR